MERAACLEKLGRKKEAQEARSKGSAIDDFAL